MKFAAKFVLSLLAIYVVIWLAVATYFSFAEQQKELLESNLSSLFKRSVSIESVHTTWDGFSPSLQVNGLTVAGDTPQQPALAFQRLSAKLNPLSVLMFWPRFTDVAIDKPEVEIVSLDNGKLQIAGIALNTNQSASLNPKKVISWLLNHENAAWHDGSIVWRQIDGAIDTYEDISFVYQRELQKRSVQAVVKLPENGTLAFKSISHGDVINSNDWDASLEVLGNQKLSLLGPDDLSLTVEEGKGRLLLKQLRVRQLRDFLQLTGIGGTNNWVLQSQLSGQLSDVQLEFSGPLLGFTDWSLTATAAEVSFESTLDMPAMNNLSGSLDVNSSGGTFNFATQSAEFEWQRWFSDPFPINEAAGTFTWDLSNQNKVVIKLNDGLFNGRVSKIKNLNASAEIAIEESRINNFADLFKVGPLKNLTFQDGDLVRQTEENKLASAPIYLEASADFDVPSIRLIENYFPIDARIQKFRQWWSDAVVSGSASNGRIQYQGDITKDALYDGTATLEGQINFTDVELDYGYERDWPVVRNASGIAKIDNSVLSFLSDEAWLEDDQISAATVAINSIFRRDRALTIEAQMESSLPKVMDFLFAGPLIKKSELNDSSTELPITAEAGTVSAEIAINIPLASMKEATVSGTASVTNGQLLLPQGVPVSDIKGDVFFTEKSADSDNIQGLFLGGETRAELQTTEAAQPPKLKLIAEGHANIKELQPWIGEHLMTWFDGETDWQGNILIDGPSAQISTTSNTRGVQVNAPAPLSKIEEEERPLEVFLQVGNDVRQNLTVSYGDDLVAKFAGNPVGNNLMDRGVISIGGGTELRDGINFDIQYDQINIDEWLQSVIALAKLETTGEQNTLFLDSMRSVKIKAKDPILLGRKFGDVDISAISNDGGNWIGSITGDNIDGIIQAKPRDPVASYDINLSKLYIPEGAKEKPPLDPIDQTLSSANYPIIDLNVNSFRFVRKQLGRLQMRGEPIDGAWKLTTFALDHQGVRTTAEGQWVNSPETGTISDFTINTVIDEAGGALQELDMGGLVSRGEGSLTANISWIGAPHEFDYSRLNGDFDLRIQDGELVKVEPGTGKLLGLLNFNAIARRLTLDFSDVFSSGLEFDRMRYAGVFADGEAIMREAYIFTPAVFVRVEGKIDLDKELIDMEIHLSPELGGNLTLLSALANPAAGAVVFLTQQIFKDEMRASSYKSYRALGSWEDFELVEFKLSDEQADSANINTSSSTN